MVNKALCAIFTSAGNVKHPGDWLPAWRTPSTCLSWQVTWALMVALQVGVLLPVFADFSCSLHCIRNCTCLVQSVWPSCNVQFFLINIFWSLCFVTDFQGSKLPCVRYILLMYSLDRAGRRRETHNCFFGIKTLFEAATSTQDLCW